MALLLAPLAPLTPTAFAQDAPSWEHCGITTRCDVHVGARVGGVTEEQAGERPRVILDDHKPEELRALREAGATTLTPTGWEVCRFDEPGSSYRDAELLAACWSVSDPAEAKARMEAKLIDGDHELLAAIVAEVRGGAPPGSREDAIVTSSGYDSCDVATLAAYWGVSSADAMAEAAGMIEATDKGLRKALKEARKKFPTACAE